jgi:hypothetical protein
MINGTIVWDDPVMRAIKSKVFEAPQGAIRKAVPLAIHADLSSFLPCQSRTPLAFILRHS